MKIAQYIEQQKATLPSELATLLINDKDVWSNEACYGYVIQAMKNAGYEEEKICDMILYLHSVFDETSVTEAEEIYRNW